MTQHGIFGTRVRSLLTGINERQGAIILGVSSFLIIVRIWLIAGFPKMYLLAPYDDLYFARMAHYIIHGQWMGPYNQFTLIKAPFFGFFLALSSLTGLPLLLNESLFYALGCAVLYFAVSPVVKSAWWRLLLFALMLFSPASLITYWTLRVYREFVFASLTLCVVAFSVGLFLRIGAKLWSAFLWAAGLGASMGAFMLCREEGPWIYPVLGLLLAVCVWRIWRAKLDRKWLRSAIAVSPILIWYIPILAVSFLNYLNYGFWGYSETMDPNLYRVVNTIARIPISFPFHYNAITRESFAKAYKAAPLLAKLEAPIEGNWPAWQQAATNTTRIMPDWYRREYLPERARSINSHVVWMLRDALFSAGYYSSGRYPGEYVRQLADQLQLACISGALPCVSGVDLPYAGSLRVGQIPIVARFFGEALYDLVSQDISTSNIAAVDLQNWPADQADFRYFDEVVYNPIGSTYIGVPQNESQFVGGQRDARFELLDRKEAIMNGIQSLYRDITLPGFLILLPLGLAVLIIVLARGGRGIFVHQGPIVFLFVLGLLFSRTITLAMITTNSGFDAMYYSGSHYVFIHLILFLMAFYPLSHAAHSIPALRRQAGVPTINS